MRETSRWGNGALLALIVMTVLVTLGVEHYQQLWQIARGDGDSPFLSDLDVLMWIGVPLAAGLFALDSVQQRFRLTAGLVSDPTTLYRLYDKDDVLLYAGITRHMEARMKAHSLTKSWWGDVARKEAVAYDTRIEAARAEHAAITYENPRHNVARLSREAHVRSAGAR